MNKLKNIKVVERCGDAFQLEFGAEFGFYAKQLDRNFISIFCNQFNLEPWANEHGYTLTTKYNMNDHIVTLTNFSSTLRVPVRLLDHSIYIDANEHDWSKIDKQLFALIQKCWRNFMARHINEYEDHIRKTIILADLDTACAI